MKARKILKISLVSLLVLALAGYVAYAVLYLSEPDENERCVAVELKVQKGGKANFVNEAEIETMLKDGNVYPKGALMKDVNTKKIEELIRTNDFVEKVECYKSSSGKLCVNVEQRQPVIYVIPEGRDGYFVDVKGKIIPSTCYVVNLVTASGQIDDKFASTKLAEFGQYLQTDAFWNNQIEQLYVTRGKKGNYLIDIVPRVGDHTVHLGSLDDYQHKLHNLRTFYEKAMGTVGWNKYAKINLEYANQVICTRHTKK